MVHLLVIRVGCVVKITQIQDLEGYNPHSGSNSLSVGIARVPRVWVMPGSLTTSEYVQSELVSLDSGANCTA